MMRCLAKVQSTGSSAGGVRIRGGPPPVLTTGDPPRPRTRRGPAGDYFARFGKSFGRNVLV